MDNKNVNNEYKVELKETTKNKNNNCIIYYDEQFPEKFDSQIQLESLLKYKKKEGLFDENLYKYENNIFENKKYQLKLKIDRNEKFLFINKIYFLINGQIKIGNKKYNVNIKRSFSDFFLLNSILVEEYYYKVFPIFPKKNFTLKFLKKEKILDERKNDLEIYINYLIEKKEVLNSKRLFEFFFNNNFEFNTKRNISLNEIAYKIKKKFYFINTNGIKNSQKFTNIHSEVTFLDFFINKLRYKLRCYKNNRIELYLAFNNFFSNIKNYNREKNYLSLSSIYVNKKTNCSEFNNEFNHFIPFFEILNNQIKNCKEALERQVEIYSDYQKLSLLAKNDESNILTMMINKNLIKKSKIDIDLKKELQNEIKKIHVKLADFLNKNFVNFFQELFSEKK